MMQLTRSTSIALLALAISAQNIVVTRAEAPPAQYRAAAEKITEVLLENGWKRVAVGSFVGEGDINRATPGMRLAFIDTLEEVNRGRSEAGKESVSVEEDAEQRLEADIEIVDDPTDLGSPENKRFLVVKNSLKLLDGEEEVFPLTFYLDRSRDIIQAAGVGISLSSDDSRDIHKQIRRVLKKSTQPTPQFQTLGSKIKNSSRSPYAIELLTKSPIGPDYSPRPPKSDSGAVPFVPIGVGEIYAVKFYNDSDREVAIGMQIDGIDQFQFSQDRDPETGRPKFSRWIVGPRKSFTIKGWHITIEKGEDNLASFLVTKYGEGAAQHVNRPDDSQDGVITLSVSHSHDPSSGSAKASAQTGFGPPIRQDQKAVRRKIDAPHEFFSIRYAR